MKENEIEQEFYNCIRFICGFPQAKTTISKQAVNYWLKNSSDTVFVNGKLRQVVFVPITEEMYRVYTEAI